MEQMINCLLIKSALIPNILIRKYHIILVPKIATGGSILNNNRHGIGLMHMLMDFGMVMIPELHI